MKNRVMIRENKGMGLLPLGEGVPAHHAREKDQQHESANQEERQGILDPEPATMSKVLFYTEAPEEQEEHEQQKEEEHPRDEEVEYLVRPGDQERSGYGGLSGGISIERGLLRNPIPGDQNFPHPGSGEDDHRWMG